MLKRSRALAAIIANGGTLTSADRAMLGRYNPRRTEQTPEQRQRALDKAEAKRERRRYRNRRLLEAQQREEAACVWCRDGGVEKYDADVHYVCKKHRVLIQERGLVLDDDGSAE